MSANSQTTHARPATRWSGRVRPLCPADRSWVETYITDAWGGPTIVSGEHEHVLAGLDGFVAIVDDGGRGDEPGGLITVYADGDGCEVVTLNSLRPSQGAGRALMGAAGAYARERGCRRLWLLTTNDNTRALRFYQMLGMRVTAWRAGVINEQRRRKPSIPLLGNDGIPIRDEVELTLDL